VTDEVRPPLDDRLPDGIETVVERLLDRHLAGTREWFPHEYAASETGPVGPLAPGVASALLVNLLTEDGLPYYTSELEARLGRDGPWGRWARQWTAEEQRHGIAIREWVHVTGALDPVELERARMATITAGTEWHGRTLIGAIVYVAVQELATRVAHRRTGQALADQAGAGAEMLRRVSADENLHFLFYRDLVASMLETEPALTMAAIDDVLWSFAMPGTAIPGFREHSQAIARAGIYSWTVHGEHVLVPLLRHWRIDDVDGADAAQASIHRHVDRVRRVGARLDRMVAPAAG
jgi:acyl-[acyl-carrier-protein] desaturase